jgi:hypothetical protein
MNAKIESIRVNSGSLVIVAADGGLHREGGFITVFWNSESAAALAHAVGGRVVPLAELRATDRTVLDAGTF